MDLNSGKYKVYTWKNWIMLHWILNPGLAFNELILGQRIPKIYFEDQTSDQPRIERTFVPCPHCKTIHDSRIWSIENGVAFQNWFGLYCHNCRKIIPCLMNWLSFLILVITFPIWGWFKQTLKKKWLKKQPKRYENIEIKNTPNPFDKKSWINTGLSWGAFMFLCMSILYPYLTNNEISLKTLLLGLVIWTIGGLVFGYLMKIYFNKVISKIK